MAPGPTSRLAAGDTCRLTFEPAGVHRRSAPFSLVYCGDCKTNSRSGSSGVSTRNSTACPNVSVVTKPIAFAWPKSSTTAHPSKLFVLASMLLGETQRQIHRGGQIIHQERHA